MGVSPTLANWHAQSGQTMPIATRSLRPLKSRLPALAEFHGVNLEGPIMQCRDLAIALIASACPRPPDCRRLRKPRRKPIRLAGLRGIIAPRGRLHHAAAQLQKHQGYSAFASRQEQVLVSKYQPPNTSARAIGMPSRRYRTASQRDRIALAMRRERNFAVQQKATDFTAIFVAQTAD